MAILFYAATIAAILYFLYRRQICRSPLCMDWPILGMLPTLLYNVWYSHDFITDSLKQQGGTAEFMGPWFTKMNYVFTMDPMNVHHILSKSFDTYLKGPEFREIFESFGDGIIAVDSEAWKPLRSLFHSLIRDKSFNTLVEKTLRKKVESSLLPVLDHVRRQGTVVNLQDVFSRLAFDATSIVVLGHDPNCLSIEFPEVKCAKAFDEAQEVIFYRHVVPKSVWKLQGWLQIGKEKQMTRACKVFDEFLYENIASKRQELRNCNGTGTEIGEAHPDVLTALLRSEENYSQVYDDKFLRDTTFTLFVAGRDTISSGLTWFFWLVATNPSVEAKILAEIEENFGANSDEKHKALGMEEVKKLIYLHGALCEALRLFPPIPLERKQSTKHDILPSGHHVNPKTLILMSFISMGKSEEMWGEDYLEFKPERWISEKGDLVHVPSYKFISFNAGPRTCLGKKSSFIQMKIVASTILRNYHIQVVEGDATLNLAIVLFMKNGLKVKLTKRGI